MLEEWILDVTSQVGQWRISINNELLKVIPVHTHTNAKIIFTFNLLTWHICTYISSTHNMMFFEITNQVMMLHASKKAQRHSTAALN